MQTRAAGTRQGIIDAAVELFTDQGFTDTGLSEITQRAHVTTGAFYYHFESKETLALAIIEDGWARFWEEFSRCIAPAGPGLESVIAMTFSLGLLLTRDKSVGLAYRLSHVLGQRHNEARSRYQERTQSLVNAVAAALRPSDIRDTVTPHSVANLVWVTIHGCHRLSSTMMDDIGTRLAESWRMLLPAIAPPNSQLYFEQFVTRTAAGHSPRCRNAVSASTGSANTTVKFWSSPNSSRVCR